MTQVEFTSFDIDAVLAARKALTHVADFAMASQVDDLLLRMRRARQYELAQALVAEIDERRGRLKVVDG